MVNGLKPLMIEIVFVHSPLTIHYSPVLGAVGATAPAFGELAFDLLAAF